MPKPFADNFRVVLPAGMHLPDAFIKLFDWMDVRGFVRQYGKDRVGTLFDQGGFIRRWTGHDRRLGTFVEFEALGTWFFDSWMGNRDPAILSRICVFAKTGAEGSHAAFWLDDNGNQKIVHLGSGSGSTLACVLAEDPVDFLRLLAIGYDEICWPEEFSKPPNFDASRKRPHLPPNLEYRNWVTTAFGVTIPLVAAEIVKHPAEMGDTKSPDPFWQWLRKLQV